MLGMIRAALDELDAAGLTEQETGQETEQVRRLLAVVGEDTCSSKELMARLGLAHRPTFLYYYLRPAIDGGWLEMTDPGHPRSPRQRYRLTAAAGRLVAP